MTGWADPLNRQGSSTSPLTLSNMMPTRPRRMCNRMSGGKFFSQSANYVDSEIHWNMVGATCNKHGHSHDAFRQDTSSTASSLKPSGQQSLGDKVEQKIDQWVHASHLRFDIEDGHWLSSCRTQSEVQRMRPSLSRNRPETTLHLVTTLLVLVGSCTKSGTRSLVTAVKTPTSIRLNDSKAKCWDDIL